MPSNLKEKKAAKRKNQKKQASPRNPYPYPNSQDAGNGKEDESEDTFMTPRSQPDLVDFSRMDEIDGFNVVESSDFEDERLKNMKLEESVVVDDVSNDLNVQIVSNDDGSSKVMKLKESVVGSGMSNGWHNEVLSEIGREAKKDDEVFEETMESPIEKDVLTIEQSAHVDDAIDYSSSSNEKEVKVVPLPNEEKPVDNGDANANVQVIHSEMGNEVDGNTSLGRDLKATKLDEQLIPVIEKSKEGVGSVQQDLPQVDENLIDKMLGKSIEEIFIPVENSVSAIEEHNGRVKETVESFPDAGKTEIAERNEVSRDPMVVRHATLWNCCGLLEVLASSDK